MTLTSTPMLALAPGHARARGQAPDTTCPRRPAAASTPPPPRSTAPATAGSITRLVQVPPVSATDPGLREVTVPASSLRLDAYDAWLSHVWTASACSRPVLLRGSVRYVDPATGEVTGTVGTDDLPDKVIYKPCGNRRASTCPGCAETYRRDAFHLLRAGLAGGKGIPETVAAHPVVFATFTAPSFVRSTPGLSAVTPASARSTATARPSPATPAATPVPARMAGAWPATPATPPAMPASGEPLCPDCYDYPAARRLECRRRGTMAPHQAGHRAPPGRPCLPP